MASRASRRGGYMENPVAGGIQNTKLGPGNDGFTGVQSHKGTFASESCTEKVGREPTTHGSGRKRGKKAY